MLRVARIYGLLDEPASQDPLPCNQGRERKLYIALLVLASMNVFAVSAALSMMLLLRFG